MKFASMLRRLRNTQSGMGSTARSGSTPYYEPPVAEAGSNQTVLVGETVSFSGSGSSGNNLRYSWAFGAGATPATGSGITPSCTYSTPGTKVVTLTVTDNAGATASDTVTINVHSAPVADAGSNQTVLVGETVNFDGSGSYDPDGGNLTYSWAFGSGATPATGSGATPSCTYSTPGTKTVTLTVTDNNGATASDTVTVTVDLVPPCPKLGSDRTVLVGETVYFDGSGSTGNNLSYSWDFGTDATPANGSGATPTCTYSTIGAKTVRLTVTDDNGATASDTVIITVHNAPIANAGSDQDVSVGATVNFDGSGSSDPDGGNLTYSWAFGTDATPVTGSGVMPSCSYSTTGAKTVTLTVTDDEGVSRSDTVTITVHSLPVADAGGDQGTSVGETVNFDGSGSEGSNLTYSWDFGADAIPADDTGDMPSCTYSTPGDKIVRLTVTDVAGATASDTVIIYIFSWPPPPPVAEAGEPQTVLVGETVNFDGSRSTGNNLVYSWAFGTDATPATGRKVESSCSYSTSGEKTVTLTVTDVTGDERPTDSDEVTITVHEAPIANAGDDQTVLVSATVSFDGSGSSDPDGGELSYSWDFGADATPATGSAERPSCTYSTIGTKTVTLTVTDDEGVSRSDTVTITVHEAPIADAGGDKTVLVNETVGFDGSGSSDPDGGNLIYSWDFGTDATPATGSGVVPYCTYSTTGAKTVTLTVTDDEGATASDTVTITVHNPPCSTPGNDQTVLVGETVSFDGSGSCDPDGGELSYSWDFGTDATPATGTGAMPSCTYSTTGTKIVTLIVTDDEGATDSDTVTITVHEAPIAEAGSNQTVSINETVSFDGSGSYDPDGGNLSYSWDFGADATPATDTGETTSCTYSTTGTKMVTLTVTDDEGVSRSDTVTITVRDEFVVDAGSNQTVLVNETVNFAGSASNAPEGVTLSYSWDFGPDSTPATGSGVMPSCTYSMTGAKTVTLTVSYTANGKTVEASDMVTITVHDAPIPDAGRNQRVAVGSEVSFDGSGSRDPDGGNLTYLWAFGTDATSATGTGVAPSCTYSTTGAKTVTLTVTDDEGVSRSDTVTITVYNPPVADAGNDQDVLVNETVNFDGSRSSDPDGGDLTYAWAFGADATSADDTGDMPSCTYSTPGTKVVRLTVTDDEGATASDRVTINVTSPDPTTPVANAGSDQTVVLGREVSFSGLGSTGNNLSYSWDFDTDATSSTATPSTASTVTTSCIYRTTGDKTVTLTVTQGEGDQMRSDTDTLTVTVVSIEPKTVNDGESVDFEVLGAESATVFSWGWEIPSELGSNPDVGNNPEVVFSPTDSRETTIDNAKWYAYPNRECPTRRLDAASKSSVYTITCDMTFPDGRSFTASSTLTVNVPWVFAGFIEIGFSGSPTIEWNSETELWEVTGRGSIERSLSSKNSVPMSSQFYDKVRKHEAVHITNLDTGIASGYYTVNGLWANHLMGLTAKNRADLEILIQWAVEDFIDAENERIRSLVPQLERAAYTVSDAISPQYLYQRCNRFPE